ncbi:MAG: hypothetical protein N2316_11460 [Spirochaetes bacterium]|nr:hypothetical protein [Spirochaetota bacterium]
MRKLTAIFCFVIIPVVIANGQCKKRYADINDALTELIKMQETYINAIQKAKTAEDVAKAINDYADSFTQLRPKIESFEGKYPELKEAKEPPEELKENFAKLEQSAMKLTLASKSISKEHISSPVVQQAIDRLVKLSRRPESSVPMPNEEENQ